MCAVDQFGSYCGFSVRGVRAGVVRPVRAPLFTPVPSAAAMKTVRAIAVCAVALVALVAILCAAAAAAVKPKPWQWKPQKVVARLTAASPIEGGDVGSKVMLAVCTGRGRGVAGRFSRFTCDTRYGGWNGLFGAILTIRILPIGTGKLCVVTTIGARGVPVAVPYTPGTEGTRIVPGRACP